MNSNDDLQELAARIPRANAERFAALVALTDAFCDARLTPEYKELCRRMAAAVCRKKSLALTGKIDAWAAGIAHAVGRVNFLGDPSQTPHRKAAEVATCFGVSTATMQAKTRVVWQALKLMPMHPNWCLPGMLDDNPTIWLLMVDGVVIDIRTAPRELQVAAFEKGFIPYIPADRMDAGME
jgi:hypothetical protein